MNTLVIDPTPLDAIRALEQPGTESLLDTIINMFLDQSVELAGQIRAAVDSGNAAEIREAAHSLKTSSANVGAMQVSALSYDLEVAGRDGVLDYASALSDRLDVALREANSALAAIVAVAHANADVVAEVEPA